LGALQTKYPNPNPNPRPALPPFRKRKQHSSTTKDIGLPTKNKKVGKWNITADIANINATMQL